MPTIHLDDEEETTLDVGWLVRIIGLEKAPQWNGQVGSVKGFLIERQRYEVELLGSKDIKMVQARNLEQLPILEEVGIWCKLLEQSNGDAEEPLVLRQLERLEEINMTVDLLVQTKVGKAMNEFAKRVSNDKPTAANKARQLVAKWKGEYNRSKEVDRKNQEEAEKEAAAAAEAEAKAKQAVKVAPEERCLARENSKGQCKNRRHQPKFLCGLHQRVLDQNGQLEHGWFSEKPEAKAANPSGDAARPSPKAGAATATAASVGAHGAHGVHGLRSDVAIRMHSNKSVTDVKPMASPEDAVKLVESMRSVPPDAISFRLGLLVALDTSPRHCMNSFVRNGGVEILSKWLRKSAEVRFACLMVLQKLPVTPADVQKAELVATVKAIQSQDQEEGHRTNAAALIERWKAAGFLTELPSKRRRVEPSMAQPQAQAPQAAPVMVADPVADPMVQVAQPRTPPLETLPPARPEEIPDSLQALDPRIARVLMDRPGLFGFLQKHPDVLQNLNADSLSFLQRNLKNVQRTRQEAQETPETAGVTVTVSGLAERTTEQDVNQLVKDIQLEAIKVTLPRESRRKRSCGTAFVLLPSLANAQKVVERLNGARLHQKDLTVELLEDRGHATPGMSTSGGDRPRVKWKADSELWEVIVFSPEESVACLGQRINNRDFQPLAAAYSTQPSSSQQIHHSKFQAARRAEEMMESKQVRKALAGAVEV